MELQALFQVVPFSSGYIISLVHKVKKKKKKKSQWLCVIQASGLWVCVLCDSMQDDLVDHNDCTVTNLASFCLRGHCFNLHPHSAILHCDLQTF